MLARCVAGDEFGIQPPIIASEPAGSLPILSSFAQVRAPNMKTSQIRRNCGPEGLREGQSGAPYAVYNRISTLCNGFLALIGEIYPAYVEDGT